AKGIPPDRVRWAVGAGIRDVGENYVNELAETRTELRGDGAATRWHYVGVLQSGTAHRVADLADVVHTVGSVHAATRLSGRAERACSGTGPRRSRRQSMPGAWKKTLSYLGLVEEEEEDDDIQDLPEEQSMASHPASRRFGREPVSVAPSPEPAHSVIRTIPQP